MTTQPEFGSVLETLPAVQLDPAKAFYAGDSTTNVAWVKACTVCECELPGSLRLVASAEKAVGFWREVIARNPLYDAEKETFAVIFLDRKLRVSGWNLVSLGTATAALCNPREILRACLAANAQSFICLHNHPSGDPAPSAADMHATRLIREAAKTIDISFNDHVVVGTTVGDPVGRGYFSFREAGIV